MTGPTPEQAADLATARKLAADGVPIFVAPPDPESSTGFRLPNRWQRTAAEPSSVDAWRPGWALCAVMGHRLDLLDVDPRNGGVKSLGLMAEPTSYGATRTPSGGYHSFIASLWVGSRDGIWPGIDIKGGMPDGSSRGFAFLPPTVRLSKATKTPAPYEWVKLPDLAALDAEGRSDLTGAGVADRVRAVRADSGAGIVTPAGPRWWVEVMTNKGPHDVAAAQQAISTKLDEVRTWTAGETGFRTTLLRAALTLGGYVGARPDLFDEADMREQLEAAAAAVWNGADEDDRQWIEQGITDGQIRPFHVYTPEDEAEYGAGDIELDEELPPEQWPTIQTGPFDPTWCLSDQEFAEAILAYLRPVLRYAVDARTWIVPDGDKWDRRGDLASSAVARAVECMPPGITPIPDKKKISEWTPGHWQAWRKAELASSRRSGAIATKIGAVVKLGGHPSCVVLTELDADPVILWAGGMPFDLSTGTLSDSVDAAAPHLRTAAVVPDRSVSTPKWDAFLATVWPDADVRSYALDCLSTGLVGRPKDVVPILFGPAGSGKTSTIAAIVNLMGNYGDTLAHPIVTPQCPSYMLADLLGIRLALLDEAPPTSKSGTEQFKMLTGMAPIRGAAKYEASIKIPPTWTFALTSNLPPNIVEGAIRRRLRLIPCDAPNDKVAQARRELDEVWTAEAPGILADLIERAGRWLADPTITDADRVPDVVADLADDLRAEQDHTARWLASVEVKHDPGGPGTTSTDLYRPFTAWWSGQGLDERERPAQNVFGAQLDAAGFPGRKGGKGRRTRPLRVTGHLDRPAPTSTPLIAGWPMGGTPVGGTGGRPGGTQLISVPPSTSPGQGSS